MNGEKTVPADKKLLQLMDEALLTVPYLRAIGTIVIAAMFDYFDFILIGFIVAVIGPA